MKKSIIILLIWSLAWTTSHAQVDTVSTNDAEVLDIFFLRNIDSQEKDSLWGIYRTELTPIAKDYGYKPLKSFRMKNVLEGSSQPHFVLIAQWSDYQKREDFINDIVVRKPFFHDLRRQLWSTFDLTYYKLDKDILLSVDQSKYNVISAIWVNDHCREATVDYKQKIKSAGGDIRLYLPKGKSPRGYYYNPDHFILSSWQDADAFKKYKLLTSLQDCMININEFEI